MNTCLSKQAAKISLFLFFWHRPWEYVTCSKQDTARHSKIASEEVAQQANVWEGVVCKTQRFSCAKSAVAPRGGQNEILRRFLNSIMKRKLFLWRLRSLYACWKVQVTCAVSKKPFFNCSMNMFNAIFLLLKKLTKMKTLNKFTCQNNSLLEYFPLGVSGKVRALKQRKNRNAALKSPKHQLFSNAYLLNMSCKTYANVSTFRWLYAYHIHQSKITLTR